MGDGGEMSMAGIVEEGEGWRGKGQISWTAHV